MTDLVTIFDADGLPVAALDANVVYQDALELVESVVLACGDQKRVRELIFECDQDQPIASTQVLGMALMLVVNPVIAALMNRLNQAGIDNDEIRDVIRKPFLAARGGDR